MTCDLCPLDDNVSSDPRAVKRGLEGGHGSPSECEYYRPDKTVTAGDREYHGCDYDASPGACPFGGDLALCGERE
jgi:hypothetical protein